MRRLARILVNGLTVLSLLAGMAAGALWVLSHWRPGALVVSIWREDPYEIQWGHHVEFTIAPGRLRIIDRYTTSVPDTRELSWHADVHRGPRGQTVIDEQCRIGVTCPLDVGDPDARSFHYASGDGCGFGMRLCVLPLWAVVGALGILPAARAIGWLRRPRGGEGLCPVCGYDLRATPDRCPECGNAPAGRGR